MSEGEASRAAMPQFVRPAAAAALAAVLLGRAIAPALRGAREGLDRIIGVLDFAGGFSSYLFAFVGLSASIVALMATFRERRLSLAYRIAAAVLGACVVSIIAPAFREPLPERASAFAALASSVLAILASRETLAVVRTRALGIVLLFAGTAALLHLVATLLAWYAGGHALYRAALYARVLATASALFDTFTLVTAFGWLITRGEKATVWSARIALLLAFAAALGATRASGRENASLWELVMFRALDRQVPVPPAYVWLPYRYALEAAAPLLGVAALAARKQIPGIVGCWALVLAARPSTDIPLSALALTLAALSSPLAARDDRGMWAVLMANSGRSEPLEDAVDRQKKGLLGPNSP